MIPLHPLSLPLQVHMPFMRYISVGCVVGIIAGFCIGPGKLLLFVSCVAQRNGAAVTWNHGGSEDASVTAGNHEAAQ